MCPACPQEKPPLLCRDPPCNAGVRSGGVTAVPAGHQLGVHLVARARVRRTWPCQCYHEPQLVDRRTEGVEEVQQELWEQREQQRAAPNSSSSSSGGAVVGLTHLTAQGLCFYENPYAVDGRLCMSGCVSRLVSISAVVWCGVAFCC